MFTQVISLLTCGDHYRQSLCPRRFPTSGHALRAHPFKPDDIQRNLTVTCSSNQGCGLIGVGPLRAPHSPQRHAGAFIVTSCPVARPFVCGGAIRAQWERGR